MAKHKTHKTTRRHHTKHTKHHTKHHAAGIKTELGHVIKTLQHIKKAA